MAKKETTNSKKPQKNSAKYNLIDDLHEKILKISQVNSKGEVVIKKADLKKAIEDVFTNASKEAVKGNKVRFPILGILTMKDIPARKAGKQKNPFTGEMVEVPARPASRKPKWSFPKSLKEFFADKKNWK
ncbi:MAG: HU family DNA-binding protein [Leptonema sp. (in: bacteria)]|jgi:nucleoid DNA-binding protein